MMLYIDLSSVGSIHTARTPSVICGQDSHCTHPVCHLWAGFWLTEEKGAMDVMVDSVLDKVEGRF